LGYQIKGQNIFCEFEERTANIQIITPEIIRVFCPLESESEISKAIEGEKEIPTVVNVQEKEEGLWISTEKVKILVSDDFYVDFYDAQNREICMDYRGERKELERISPEHVQELINKGFDLSRFLTPHAFEVKKMMQGTEHFYGLGEKAGFLDKRHYEYEMWNTDDGAPHVDSFKVLYKSIPFFITLTDTHVYGIFMDNTYKSFFNMGQESEDYYFFGATAGNLDYYYLAGCTMPEILEKYTYLTGTCPVPAKWALGYHQSRFGYRSWEDVKEVAEKLRFYDIPCDVIHFDIDYMKDYRVFTWNEELYQGSPKDCLQKLAEKGFKAVTINDPGVKVDEEYEIYREGIERDFFVKTPQGEPYVNAVWPGDAVFPDFGNPKVREWWGEKQQFLLDKGVRGIWNDMNEPAGFKGPFPDDIVFSDGEEGSSHAKMHNVYGHLMAKACYDGLKNADGRRPFVITRACYAGSQKYSCAWTGDNHSIWAHLQMVIPQLCNLGLSGMPFVGTDIGGFGSDTTPELLARWIQVGCFSPLFRNHCALGSIRQEPWQFGPKVLQIYRKYVKLRYRWIPYYYDLFFEGEKSGAPIMRPLVYHYEKDEIAKNCNDEFLIGQNVLVAPVVNQGADRRMVYLPEGEWYDYWTKEKLTGPLWLIREASLEVCPIYIKAGSVIPTMEPKSYIDQKPDTVLTLDVYPGEGEYDHYLDNGEDFAYREGKLNHYHFCVDRDGEVKGYLLHAGYENAYEEIRVSVLGQERELSW